MDLSNGIGRFRRLARALERSTHDDSEDERDRDDEDLRWPVQRLRRVREIVVDELYGEQPGKNPEDGADNNPGAASLFEPLPIFGRERGHGPHVVGDDLLASVWPVQGPLADESHLPAAVRSELEVALRYSLRWAVFEGWQS